MLESIPWVIYLLFGLSLSVVYVFLDRFQWFRKYQKAFKSSNMKTIWEFLDLPKQASAETAFHLIMSEATKGRDILGLMAALAPVLGLLGTIEGMMEVFYKNYPYTDFSVGAIGNGIASALITTQVGLTIAIMAIFCERWLNSMRRRVRKNFNPEIGENNVQN